MRSLGDVAKASSSFPRRLRRVEGDMEKMVAKKSPPCEVLLVYGTVPRFSDRRRLRPSAKKKSSRRLAVRGWHRLRQAVTRWKQPRIVRYGARVRVPPSCGRFVYQSVGILVRIARIGCSLSPEELRSLGRCPLTPEEAALMLSALGYNHETYIYLAGSQIYGGQSRMLPFTRLYPNVITKEDILTPVELAPFRNYSSQVRFS
ncbi:hypothetical protein GW17_00036851 [Ensete ventricosum]|nr:hypothetical protein GW17_00036851 [Ensete ventricosum]RZS19225.1 hypothetical protein BHM03_00051604 [Ensete ventricosum]